jgi:tRNA (adenine37-N6)-methyltransferase
METTITYKPIGIIRTSFEIIEGMPFQPHGAPTSLVTIELDPELLPGLKDIEGFSHLILIFHFHRVKGHRLYVVPFMDEKPHGIFATRAPVRPNPIGLSIVKLIKVEGNFLFVEGADMLNGTPLLDIKPFFTQSDNRPDAVSGWLDGKESIDIQKVKSDNRFDINKNPGVNRCK